MKKLFSIMVSMLFVATLRADDVSGRAKFLVNDYYETYKNSKELEKLKANVVVDWSFSCLVLNKDVETANKYLARVLKDQENHFTKLQDKKYFYLYGTLPTLAKLCVVPELTSRLTSQNTQAIKSVLYDFVRDIMVQDLADSSPAKVLRMYKSENHDMLHKGLYLIIAQILKSDPNWSRIKYNDGRGPAEHYKQWKLHLMENFRQRAMQGLNVEVACPGYTSTFLEPVFLIYDCCEDKSLRNQAGNFLTLFFADAAQETLNGVRGGARVRVYRQRAFPYLSQADRTSVFLNLLTGLPAEVKAKDHPCLDVVTTSYRLPDVVRELFITPDKGIYGYTSMRLGRGDHVFAKGLPGEPEVPFYIPKLPATIMRYSYCTPKYVLGWFSLDEREHYTLISSQSQLMGLITSATADSRIVFDVTPSSSIDDRTGYRDLQAIGNKHAMLIRKQLAAIDDAFLRVYVSNDFSIEEGKTKWLFGRNGDSTVYYGLKAGKRTVGANTVLYDLSGEDTSDDDAYRIEPSNFPGRYIRFLKRSAVLAFEVALAQEYQSFDAFKQDLANDDRLRFINHMDQCDYKGSRDAGLLTMYVDLRKPAVNGKELSFPLAKTYDSPYIQADFMSSRITLNGVDGRKITIEF